MSKLYGWTAKRSGAFITIEGADMQGNFVKIAQVETIEIDEEGPFATAHGKTHRLASDNLPF